jgi:hypothetical protein
MPNWAEPAVRCGAASAANHLPQNRRDQNYSPVHTLGLDENATAPLRLW